VGLVPGGASVPRDLYTRGRGIRLRPGVAKLRTRSALAVLPGFDGFLRLVPCRFVAPCCRSWGSPRFRSFTMRFLGLLAEPSAARSASVSSRSPRPALPHPRLPGCPKGLPFWSGVARARAWLDLPRWRHTLRSVSLDSSRVASPRPLPSRRWTGLVWTSESLPRGKGSSVHPAAVRRPQGFAPLASPLRRRTLPSRRRSMLPWASVPCEGRSSAAATRVASPSVPECVRACCGSVAPSPRPRPGRSDQPGGTAAWRSHRVAGGSLA
jgi:hypothetical protein